MPSYIAQQAFGAFQAAQAAPDYVWPATPEAQDAEMREYTRLKVAAMKEEKANQDEQDAAQSAHVEQWNADLRAEMISKGYSGDFRGTLADFQKLFTRPNLNSAHSLDHAAAYFDAGDQFVNHYLIHRESA